MTGKGGERKGNREPLSTFEVIERRGGKKRGGELHHSAISVSPVNSM